MYSNFQYFFFSEKNFEACKSFKTKMRNKEMCILFSLEYMLTQNSCHMTTSIKYGEKGGGSQGKKQYEGSLRTFVIKILKIKLEDDYILLTKNI